MGDSYKDKVESIIKFLFAGIFISVALLFIQEQFFPKEDKLFQFLSTLGASFMSSFFTRIKMKEETKSATQTLVRDDQVKTTTVTE